ncbi:MAG: sigma-70 family RNA polymerase sigma factor [Pirellulaceae bacterium]|nr:sigma-70 family RNA polymerase sigma factor [Planctomycetales bacterium]
MQSEVELLIDRARRDDLVAFDRLLQLHRNYLHVLAQLWLAPEFLQKADPSDLVQEAFLKAHQKFHQFQGSSAAEWAAWLRRILSRAVVDFIRQYHGPTRDITREEPLEYVFFESGDRFAALLAQSGSSPSQQAQRRELGVLLADALSLLPENHRQVIVLRSLKEMDWKDVASIMDRAIGTVRAMWLRALVELREHLEEV